MLRIDPAQVVDVETIVQREAERMKQFGCMRDREDGPTMCLHLDNSSESVPAVCECYDVDCPVWMLKTCPLAHMNSIMEQAMQTPPFEGMLI